MPQRDSGQSLSEYGLILGLVVIISIPVVMTLGAQSTQNLGSVAANRSQLDRLSGLLGAPALAPSGSSPSSGGGSITGAPGIPANPGGRTMTVNGTPLVISRDANGLIQVRSTSPDPNNANLSSADGSVTRLLAQQFEAMAQESSGTDPEKASSLLALAHRFQGAAGIQDQFDQALSQLGNTRIDNDVFLSRNGTISGPHRLDQFFDVQRQVNDFAQGGEQPVTRSQTDYNQLMQFLSANPELLQDPQVKPLLDLGTGIYYANFVKPDAVNTKLDAAFSAINQKAIDALSKRSDAAIQLGDIQGSVQSEITNLKTQLQTARNRIASTQVIDPQSRGLTPPDVDPKAGGNKTRAVADDVKAVGKARSF